MGTPSQFSNAYFCADPEGEWIEQVQEDADYESLARTADTAYGGWSNYYNGDGWYDGN